MYDDGIQLLPSMCLSFYATILQVQFRDMFTAFDEDGSGSLDSDELRSLVQKVLPSFTEGQLAFFQVRFNWSRFTLNHLCKARWCTYVANLKLVFSSAMKLSFSRGVQPCACGTTLEEVRIRKSKSPQIADYVSSVLCFDIFVVRNTSTVGVQRCFCCHDV